MAKTSDGKDGGLLVGKSHKEGGIQAVIVDDNSPVELEGEEVILTKKAMNDQGVYTVKGTPKEIASYLNSEIGGGVSFADSPDCAKKEDISKKAAGGKIQKKAIKTPKYKSSSKSSLRNFFEKNKSNKKK